MKRIGPGSYTRGFETLGHFASLLCASVRVHLLFSLFVALVLGSCSFSESLTRSERALLWSKTKGSIKAGRLPAFGLSAQDLKCWEGCTKAPFGGRTPGFLARQWLLRVVLYWLVLLVVSGLLMALRGRRMAEEEHKRGIEVVDVLNREKRKTWAAHGRAGLVALLVSTLFFWCALGTQGRENLSDLAWSELLLSSPALAVLAGPRGAHDLAWYHDHRPKKRDKPGCRGPGFRHTKHIHKDLLRDVYHGSTFGNLTLLWLLLAAELTCLWILFGLPLRRKNKRPDRMALAGVAIPRRSECSHFLFSGSPGSGKSTAIKALLDQVRARGERAIVYDPSGEYIAPYYRPGKDVILNPLDARSAPWTPWAEVATETDYAAIARSLFPRGGRDPFWNDAGGALFAAVARKLSEQQETTNARLHRLLTTGSIRDLAEFLKGTSAAKFLDADAGHMPANLIATVTSRVDAWSLLGDPKEGQTPFSIRKFVQNEGSDAWMFLAMRQDHQAALKPLVSLWCDLASTAILSLSPNPKRRLWVVLDEVASLQRLPALQPLLAQGRKHGAAVVLGLQSIPQLRDSYGADAALALASQPQTWLALRIVEPDTARWLEHALGEAEVDEVRESVSMGAESFRDGVSYQKTSKRQPAAMATELMTLPDLSGYLKLAGAGPVYRVRFDWRERPASAVMFEPKAKAEAAE